MDAPLPRAPVPRRGVPATRDRQSSRMVASFGRCWQRRCQLLSRHDAHHIRWNPRPRQGTINRSIDRSIDRSPHALLASHLVSSRVAASLTGCSTNDAHIRWRSSICIRQQSRSTVQHSTTSAMCTIEDCTVARRTTHKRWSSTCVLGFRTCLRLTTMPYVFCHPAPTTQRARSASQLSCNSPQGLDVVQRSRYSSRSGQGLLRLSTSGAFGTLPPQSQPGCADMTREICMC